MKAYLAVKEFHQKFGHVINKTFTSGLDNELKLLRQRLISEELAETVSAMHEKNLLEIADGLSDLLYVVLGTAVSYGLPTEVPFVKVSRTASDVEAHQKIGQIDILYKNAAWVFECMQDKRLSVEELCLRYSLKDMARAITMVAYQYQIPLEQCFDEVHRSNMSKTAAPPAAPGHKYGTKTPKGPDYFPPNLRPFLGM